MSKKKQTKPQGIDPRLPSYEWIISEEIKINGRLVSKGTELSIAGESGRFLFVRYVDNNKGSIWVDVVGGTRGYKMMRSFAVDRIKTVHYKNKTGENLAKERKEQKKLENAESAK